MFRLTKIIIVYFVLMSASAEANDEISFRESIAPVLLAHCHGCHNEETSEGGYRLDTFTELQRAGDSIRSPLVDANPEQSEFFRRLTTGDVDERMPSESDPLPPSTLDLIRRWIEQGARYDAADMNAPLAAILPITRHPDPPATYRFTTPVTALAFHEEAQRLLIGGYHEILVWDVESNRLVRRIPQVGGRIYRIVLGADERRIYIGSGTPGRLGEVRILDAESGAVIGVPLVTSKVVLDVALAPDEKLLAAASADRKIHVIDLRAGTSKRSIGSHSDWVHGVDWSDDGNRLASASRDKTAKVFNVALGKPVATYLGHGHDVVDVCFVSGDNTKLVSCDARGKTHLWNADSGERIREAAVQCRQAFQLHAGKHGFWLASDSPMVQQFSWTGEQEMRGLGTHQDWVLSLALDEEHQRLATGCLDGRVRIWNLADGSLLREFTAAP